jgi:transcriptional regulator of heat shock response
MKARTLQILAALIEDFVETATPVASQKLLQSGKFEISSATVRNEFAALEEIGLIESPHISAGKIPTQKGFRFFVDEFLDTENESQITTSIFERHIEKYRIQKSKESIFDVLRILASLSGNVAFAHLENDQSFYLGISNVLRAPEFLASPETVAQIIEILEGREKFQNFLQTLKFKTNEIKIFIGDENLIAEITSCAVMVTNFKTKNTFGQIGILGPIRMKYVFNQALLKSARQMIL